MKKFWIKLFVELLDDPKMGRMSDWMWRRAVELFLLAGENGNDGLLQPVEDMAWRLRTSVEKLTESLQALSQAGVVHETPDGWVVTHFKERQYSESYERVKRFKEREKNAQSNALGNEEETGSESTSTPDSSSVFERGGVGEKTKTVLPETPRQAKEHQDIRVYENVSGCFPGQRDYGVVIETVQYLREKHGEKLEDYLKPFWLAWSTRKTKDGRPYQKSSLVWLCEWAMSGDIPRANGSEPKPNWSPIPTVEETRRMIEEKEKLYNSPAHDQIKNLVTRKQVTK